VLPQVLHIKPFRDLWLGQAISQLGDSLYYVVFMFMAAKITGSVAMVGYVGAVESLPYLFFSPYAGVLADRIDRRKVMLASDLSSGLLLVVMAACILAYGNPPAWLLLGLAFALSTLRCFFLPAKSAAVPALVPQDMLLKANALSSATQSFVPLLGLGLSAGVLAVLYATSPGTFFASTVFINGLSFLASAVFIMRLPAILPDRESVERHPWHDFVDGVRYLFGQRLLMVIFWIMVVIRLMVSPFFVAYIAANDQWFGGKPQTLAWFEFFYFLGMISGSAWAGKMKIVRAGYAIAAGCGLCGLTIAAMAFSPQEAAFCVWNLLAGVALPFSDIAIVTLFQTTVPDAYRGRVNSVFSMIGMGVMPVGMVLAGVIVQRLGLIATFLIMGLGMLLAAVGGLMFPEFRNASLAPSGEAAAAAGSGEPQPQPSR
jgi:MFS family permease